MNPPEQAHQYSGDLAGYERAARALFDPMGQLVARRRQRSVTRESPFDVEPEQQQQDLAVWAAGACYLLASAAVVVDPVSRTASAPASVVGQAIQYYSAIEQWLVTATTPRDAGAPDPGYPHDAPLLMVPAVTDAAFASAMVTGLKALRDQLAGDVAALRRAAPTEAARLSPLEEVISRCDVIVSYTTNLLGPGLSPPALSRITSRVAPAINLAFRAGQVTAAPRLLEVVPSVLRVEDAAVPSAGSGMPVTAAAPTMAAAVRPSAAAAIAYRPAHPAPTASSFVLPPVVSGELPSWLGAYASPGAPLGPPRQWAMPGVAGFDPFCITDPRSRSVLDTADNRRQLMAMWQQPQSASAVGWQNRIEKALAQGDIAPLGTAAGGPAPPHERCPWSPIYVVVRTVRFFTLSLSPGTTFTLGIGRFDPPAAVPSILVDTFAPGATGRSVGRRTRLYPRALPGTPGFDRWCLTDARARDQLAADADRTAELDALWAADPNPMATFALADEIEAAMLAGRVRIAATPAQLSGATGGTYAQSPWPPICEASVPALIGGLSGVRVAAGQQFALNLHFDATSPTVRTIALGPFGGGDLLPIADSAVGPA